jgi:hypothetical protein
MNKLTEIITLLWLAAYLVSIPFAFTGSFDDAGGITFISLTIVGILGAAFGPLVYGIIKHLKS